MMPLNGVRISWLMLATNSDLAREASCARALQPRRVELPVGRPRQLGLLARDGVRDGQLPLQCLAILSACRPIASGLQAILRSPGARFSRRDAVGLGALAALERALRARGHVRGILLGCVAGFLLAVAHRGDAVARRCRVVADVRDGVAGICGVVTPPAGVPAPLGVEIASIARVLMHVTVAVQLIE